MPDQIRPAGPGKFATMVNRYVYELAQEGLNDELLATDGSWFGLLKATAHTPLYDPDAPVNTELNEAEQRFLKSKAGVVIEEAPSGQITMDYFDQIGDLDAAWEALLPRAEVAEEAAMADDLPEIPEASPSTVDDTALQQAEQDGYDDGSHGAKPGGVPSMRRYDAWMSSYGLQPDTHPQELGMLLDAWRRGLYRFAHEQRTITT